jgi:two-component system sensor histidine kinase/response regulator
MLPNERTTRSEVVTLPGEVEALIAAPSRAVARPVVEFLKHERINVQLVVSADSAFEEALLHRPSVILIDDRVPPAGGIELCQRLKSNTRTHFVPVILYAPSDVRQYRLRALAAGADAIFVPATDEQERRTRLWALLRTQAIYRRQEKKQRSQGSAIQERRRWVGSFVHDLQSSIGALQANFEYLAQAARAKGRPGSADLDECVTDCQTVFRQVVRGLRTVLDIDRFEAGRIVLREGPVVLSELARAVKSELDWHATTAGKTIEVERAVREVPARGDGDYLKEAAVNLVHFVLRQAGTRQVLIKTSAAGGRSRLTMVGDGEKIDPEDREKIFEPYARPSKQAPVGHGLGLALAKMVVELHGGTVWVEDAPRGGSAFVMELPSENGSPRLRTVE